MATATHSATADRLRTYASFVRFEHTLFSLPLLVAGVFSAPGPALAWSRWALIALAAVSARTTALALNRLIDRELDALNPRTRVRELPAGRMRLGEALGLLAASTAAYLLACAALGSWYLRVAVVPIAVFAIYPYLKRVTALCHLGVGAALGLAPLAGYAAAHPDLARPGNAILLGVFGLLWVAGFDIIYATLDEAFDRAYGVRSLVVTLGRKRALRVSALLHAGATLCAAAIAAGAWRAAAPWGGPVATLAAAAVAGLLALEVRWSHDVDLAFFKVNVVVGFAMLALVLAVRAAHGF